MSKYQRMIEKLLYLTITRADIANVVQTLSQFLQKPKVQHWQEKLRIFRYLKNQPSLGLLMCSQRKMQLTGYCDADWASCPNTRRSVTGYLLKMGDSLISWKSKKKKKATVSRSFAEAEYRSLVNLTAEVLWVSNLFKELGIQVDESVPIHCDSKAVIQIDANLVYHERTKHIEIDCHFIREKVQQGLIKIIYIPTRLQQADILTKGLEKL